MKFLRLAALALAAFVCALIAGCGDTFRPVATPLPQPSPDPQANRIAVFTSCVLNAAGTDCDTSQSGASGASTDVNVSGDTLIGITPVGRSPINALSESVLVATADRDSDTVTTYSHISLGTSTTISAPTTTGLPPGSAPVALVNANGTVYVAESGRNAVASLGGSPLAISAEISTGTNPVALTILPNGKKIYAVDAGSNDVTVIDTTGPSFLAIVPVGTHPVFAVPSADSSHVFVLNQGSNSVSVIDTSTDTAVATIPVGTSPTFAVTDVHNLRVEVANAGSGTVTVINADPTVTPQFQVVKTVTVGTNPRSLTVLNDGSRIYVANAGSNSVSVINSLSLTVTKTIPVGTAPVSIASDAESAKVLTANRDSKNVSIINTATDTELTDSSGNPSRLPAPACITPAGASCGTLSPVFVAVGPG